MKSGKNITQKIIMGLGVLTFVSLLLLAVVFSMLMNGKKNGASWARTLSKASIDMSAYSTETPAETPTSAPEAEPKATSEPTPLSESARTEEPQETTAPTETETSPPSPAAEPTEASAETAAPAWVPPPPPPEKAAASFEWLEAEGEVFSGVTIIGDSVCLGAVKSLENTIPNSFVDAAGSRNLLQGYDILMELQASDRLGEYIVVSLGTNGINAYAKQIDKIIQDVAPGHRLVFVTPYDGRMTADWSSYKTALYYREMAEKYPFVTIADWYAVIGARTELMSTDKIHIGGRPDAVKAYTDCVAAALREASQKPMKGFSDFDIW